MTAIYEALTDQQKREVRMYGCTEAQIREAIESSITFKISGPAMCAMSILSDAQEVLAHDKGGVYDFMQVEDSRQAINRAKWVISTYLMKEVA